jgi:hypothetical protein
MATFDPAPERVNQVIREVIDEYYPDLVEAGAKIGAVFAYATVDKDGEKTGPAMTKDGRQVLARIKRNSEEDRAAGKADATITFDADEWRRLDDELDGARRQRALVDHELHHLVVLREKEGNRVRTDDKGRPLFKMKPHDWEITGFKAVVERHGPASYEHEEANRFRDTYGNLLFSFAKEHATQETIPGVAAPARPRKPKKQAVVAAANR